MFTLTSGARIGNIVFLTLFVLFVTITGTYNFVHIAATTASVVTDTVQDFDLPNTGTAYLTATHVVIPPNSPGPELISGGPTGVGNMLRLASGGPVVNHNSIAFESTGIETSEQIVADFDFRITPGTGRADGLGFALLDTAHYGLTGTVEPQFIAEEPNFTGSLGIGFDIYRSDGPPQEISNNHVSVHFDGTLLQEFDVTPALDLASSQWIHAQILMRTIGGVTDVTVTLTPCGRPGSTVIDHFSLPGPVSYEGRGYFAARAGGLTADHDIDNIRIQTLSSAQSILSFTTGCYTAVESDDQALLTVTRSGNANGTVTVAYSTIGNSATGDSDYAETSGTLTFNAGENSKTITIPVRDDSLDEGDESFLVLLENPSGMAEIGGPAMAKVTIIDDERAQVEGHWGIAIPSEVIPIHAHLLPTGKVMYWDRHGEDGGWDPNPRLWDPILETISESATTEYELFCSGHSFLADGRLLVTGGHIEDIVGDDEASIYDPFTDSWTRLPAMNDGRWYPSNVTLPDGNALVVAGTFTSTVGGINNLPQVWETATNSWRDLTDAQHAGFPAFADYYPFLYVAPNGMVFNAGPQQMARYLDTTGTGAWTDVASSTLAYRDYGSSVMYDEGKVLIVGGNPRDPDLDNPTVLPSDSAEVIDLGETDPEWRTVDPMNFRRRHLNATLLPDGTVLVTGGSSAAGFDNDAGAVLAAELWDPIDETWTVLASQSLYRGYHSVALLLPDGRVLVGGGGHPDPAGGAQYNFEIFSPPYLFKGSRPVINGAPTWVPYNQPFFVETADAGNISKITWIRLSSVTHAFNQNQRINHLTFAVAPGGLYVTAPANANLAPPGHYLLFILNESGIPSMAHIIQVGPAVDTNYLPVVNR